MRKYVGMSLPYKIEVEEVEAEQDPAPDFVDLTGLVFKWKMDWDGIAHSVTPTKISTGHYQAVVKPTCSGTLFWRWEGSYQVVGQAYGTAKEGHDIILESAFAA